VPNITPIFFTSYIKQEILQKQECYWYNLEAKVLGCSGSIFLKIFWVSHVGTYLLMPWSRVLLEKLTSSHPVKKFPAFYGT